MMRRLHSIKTVIFLCSTIMLLGTAGVSATVEVTILTRLGNGFVNLEPVMRKFSEQMRKAGEDVKVTVIPGGYDKIMTMVAGGVFPDIFEIDLVEAPKLMSEGLLAPIEPFLEKDPFVDLKDFSPGMLRLGQRQGRTYMLPTWSDNSMLFCNLTKLEEAGLPPKAPKTWDDLILMCQKTTNPQKDWYGMEYLPKWGGGEFWFLFLPFVWSNGGELLNENGTESRIESPETLQALELWCNLRHMYKVTRPAPGDRFVEGKDTFAMGGSAYVNYLKQTNPDLEWDVTPFPTRLPTQAPATFIGGNLVGISSRAKHSREAWQVIKYLLSREVQVELLARTCPLPVVREYVMQNPYFQKEPKYIKFAKIAFEGGRTPYSIVYRDLTPVGSLYFGRAVEGKLPPADALKKMQHEFNVILKKVR